MLRFGGGARLRSYHEVVRILSRAGGMTIIGRRWPV